jgi:hypothetical protein
MSNTILAIFTTTAKENQAMFLYNCYNCARKYVFVLNHIYKGRGAALNFKV